MQPSVTHTPATENILISRGKNALLTSRSKLWLFLTHAKMTVISSISCMFLHFQNCEPHRNSTLTHNCACNCRPLLLSLLLLLLPLEAPSKHTSNFLGMASAVLAPFLLEGYPFPKDSWRYLCGRGILWHLLILYTVVMTSLYFKILLEKKKENQTANDRLLAC